MKNETDFMVQLMRVKGDLAPFAKVEYVDQDEPWRMMRLLEVSAEKQCTRALHDLGIIYEYGKFGIEKDFAKAIKYYEKGAALDDATCMTILGVLLVDSDEIAHDDSRAFQLFSKAASKGDAMAYDNLGNCYKLGIGAEANLDKATECYAKAAELKEKRNK